MKVPVIELMEYNTMMSLLDFFKTNLEDKIINEKNISVVSSYFDKHMNYISPSLSAEILYRKSNSVGFGSFVGEQDINNNIVELEGTLMEYRVQLNVYSNTRGENFKWCSILDETLKNGESGILLNTYDDKGSIKQNSVGIIDYNYSLDVKNNYLAPNVMSYDFHTIYELKVKVLQQYTISYDVMELGDIIGNLII